MRLKGMRPFSFTYRIMGCAVLAAFLCGACQEIQPWEVASFSFKESNRAKPRIGVISREFPEPEFSEIEEDPDSTPPNPS